MKIHLHATLLCAALLAGCSGNSNRTAADEAEPATPVQVAAAKLDTIHSTIAAEAILYPVKQANIMPKISAPVARFLAQRGDHVRQGQLVAVLEDRDLIAAAEESRELYRQAQANYQNTSNATMPEDLTKAKTDVESARQALEAAKKVYESRQALLHEGALARKLVDDAQVAMVQAQSQFETAQQHLRSLETVGRTEQLASAQAQMDAAKAHYQSAAAQLSYAEVRSPMNGIISDRPLNVGETASSSAALISIVDISQVVARANVPVHEAALTQIGKAATISGPGADLDGRVTVVSPAVDPSTTTVEVWVQAPNAGEKLKPGVTVKVSIDAGEVRNAIVVPAAALLNSDEGGEKIMVAGADSLAHERKVEVGVRSGDIAQILSGVKPGEQVITQGALGLDDKAKIEIAKPGEAPGGDTDAQ
ncbi:MAG TPA: efflux RND transporter periplasmic adaptor subunit [Bryobacteraceae bacterium]|jgi:multidrug efflux pump subunit AcrA (membrane-fusion protein)|nr:efflux RND transporter periplasmic adaptor subunit [Bryobacteraceae bacterium]